MADDVLKKQVRLSLGTKSRKFINIIGVTCFGSTELQCKALLMSPLNNDHGHHDVCLFLFLRFLHCTVSFYCENLILTATFGLLVSLYVNNRNNKPAYQGGVQKELEYPFRRWNILRQTAFGALIRCLCF